MRPWGERLNRKPRAFFDPAKQLWCVAGYGSRRPYIMGRTLDGVLNKLYKRRELQHKLRTAS